MTPDELKKLAEIAGLKKYTIETSSGFIIDEWYLNGDYFCDEQEWQPHLRIEQAMMVADTFDYYELGKDMSSAAPYYCQIFTGIGGRLIGQGISMNLPIAICVAALAAAKEGQNEV